MPVIGGSQSKNSASFDNEMLSMISGLFKDTKKGIFMEKSSQLVIKVVRGEKSKSCGMVSLNLANFINVDISSQHDQS